MTYNNKRYLSKTMDLHCHKITHLVVKHHTIMVGIGGLVLHQWAYGNKWHYNVIMRNVLMTYTLNN